MTEILPRPDLDVLPHDPLLIIDVTDEDIDRGIGGLADSCAIAQAMRRVGFTYVKVASNLSWTDRDGSPGWAELPPEATAFIGQYDRWERDDRCRCHYGCECELYDCDDDDCDDDCESTCRCEPECVCYFEPRPDPITFSVEPLAGQPT